MNYEDLLEKLEEISINLESYTDYPQAATNNARRARKWKEENGSDCGTRVGWTRSAQLAEKRPISRDTIARMASFKRNRQKIKLWQI
jgi:post-segregation antitoxin (ccd killing protein)